jgi:hypothetical protein
VRGSRITIIVTRGCFGPLVSLKGYDHLQDEAAGNAQNIKLIQQMQDFVRRFKFAL